MMTDIKKTNAGELSYLDILRSGGVIKIPLIQRDYAQGRPGKKVTGIRERFVCDLYKCIMTKSRLNLDFVYGATDNKRFIPLDGQQRLTTLFLLHLYLDGLRGRQEEKLEFVFTYETRDTSRIFCEKIIACRYELFSVESLGHRKDSKAKVVKPIPSFIIRDQAWWLNRFDADPTIDGMLRMLDTIDLTFFNDWNQAAKNLFSAGNDTILFQFLKLENFYDPDDLFIKMNARGLPLTEFEIFKGKWMEQIEKLYEADEVKRMKSLIDVYWTDFLWPLRKEKEGIKNIDPFFRNLLKLIIGNAAASLRNAVPDFDVLFEANGKELSFSYGKYVEEYGVEFNKSMLDRIGQELDVMCREDSIFTKFRKGDCNGVWIDLDKEWRFFVIQDRMSDNPNYKGRVALYAFSRFAALIPNSNDCELEQWARLMRNLIENKRFDSSDDAVKVIKDIEMMLVGLAVYYDSAEGASKVNDWVAQSTFEPDAFSKSQWEEEKIKAELRKDSDWDKEITEAEQHSYLKGKISLILWCSGEVKEKIPFDSAALKRDLAVFKSYKEKCLRLFDEAGQKDSKVTSDFLLVRAMLTKGDYMPPLPADRRNIYNNPGHRDYSWKALFRINDSTNVCALEILKMVLDDADFSSANVEESLRTIVDKRRGSCLPLWRRLLTSVYGADILSHSKQGYIAFPGRNPNNTLIYGSSKRSGYHSELNVLYIESLLKKRFSHGGVDVSAKWNLGAYDDYGITINGRTICYWDCKWYDGTDEFSTLYELVAFIVNVINNPPCIVFENGGSE